MEIHPQPGPQTQFLTTPANIAIYGGAAGGGKSFALLLEPIRHYTNPKFGAVCFRRTTKQIRNKGGLWDEALQLYPGLGGEPLSHSLNFIFPSKMRIQFAHLEHEKNVYDWQGSQIPLILFDELTHFSENQFWYMGSRNRSMTGIPGYIRGTCNADADCWVRNLIDWWIDPETGYPIPERSGVLRWFIRAHDEIHWGATPEELLQKFPKSLPKSFTFIPAKLEDNKILMEKDPQYQANLEALPYIERMRLKEGNWNIKASAGNFFRREWFEVVDAVPAACTLSLRYWDRAATEPHPGNKDPDYTVGLKLQRDAQGTLYVVDLIRMRQTPHRVSQSILNMAKQDGIRTRIYLEQDPGQAGVAEVKMYSQLLAGFDVRFNKVNQDKKTRALPASAQAEAGNIKLLRAPWNEEFLQELSFFPDGRHDDIVDALSGAVQCLITSQTGTFVKEMTESNFSSVSDQTEIHW